MTSDVTTLTYDSANRLLHATDVSGTTTYTYDANGNQLTIEEPGGDLTTNTWDRENRLVQVEHPSGDVTTSAYNGDGLRVLQDDGDVETRFVYDGNITVDGICFRRWLRPALSLTGRIDIVVLAELRV